MMENPARGFQAETAPSPPAACAILGFGYLGRPLAERLYQHGCRVSALKRRLTSDDINFQTASLPAGRAFRLGFACCRLRPSPTIPH